MAHSVVLIGRQTITFSFKLYSVASTRLRMKVSQIQLSEEVNLQKNKNRSSCCFIHKSVKMTALKSLSLEK